MQNDILCVDPFREDPGYVNPDRFRLTEGADPFQYADFQIGCTDTGGECTECSMGAGVRIPHDNGITGANEPFFREECMADTVGTDIEKILDGMPVCPVPEYFCLSRCLCVLARGDMVYHRLDPAGVENPVFASCHQVVDCYRCGYFMTHDNINLENFRPGKRLINEMCCKYFFCSGFTHNDVPFSCGVKI